eukprot:scaffold107497_cov35-Tisochrysis_lutea.AAC.2
MARDKVIGDLGALPTSALTIGESDLARPWLEGNAVVRPDRPRRFSSESPPSVRLAARLLNDPGLPIDGLGPSALLSHESTSDALRLADGSAFCKGAGRLRALKV